MFDLTVYTKDWLDGTAGFLKRNTFGSELVGALKKPQSHPSVEFTKSTDDWMTQMGPAECATCSRAYDNEYHFALNGESAEGVAVPKLPTAHPEDADQCLLWQDCLGLSKHNTRLVVTGIASNRCVLKGSVHAEDLGYRAVIVYLPAVAGKALETENWIVGSNAPMVTCEAEMKLSKGDKCSLAQKHKWMDNVYEGYKGGPTTKDAVKILRAAGVELEMSMDDLLTRLREQEYTLVK